jgi:hypothetical protein
MNTAIAFETEKKLTQDNRVAAIVAAIQDYHATARGLNLPAGLPVQEKQYRQEWVCIRLTNPENLN